MDRKLGSVLGVLIFCSTALASCPDDDNNLVSWASTIVATPNSNITINNPVLLDTSVELFGLTIASGGRLVWSSNGDYGMRAHYIRIQNGGELHIGSPTCRFNKKARITLLGEPEEELKIPGFGEKFLGVEKGGVLNLYGEDKLSWTKLTQDAPKYDKSVAEIYNHKETENIIKSHGIYIYHFKEEFPADFDITQDDGIVYVNRIHRRISYWSQSKIDLAITELKAFINGIPNGDLYAIATQKDFKREDKDYSTLYAEFDLLGPNNNFRMAGKDDAYVAVGHKGNMSSFEEDLDSAGGSTTEAIVVYHKEDRERQLIVTSKNIFDSASGGVIQFLVFNTLYTSPIISVVDDVSTWKPGDRIFITSTDYDWKQVEEFTIVPCNGPLCSSTNSVRLNLPLEYDHYGKIYKRVDMRAEVGLMTRHIVIDAEVSEGNSNGGHVKFLEGFKDVQVEGTELTNLGQPLILGRYPLHYHMCDDLANRTAYPIQSYLRKNSIHHTQFRCMTIHGTHNARIIDNVCYDSVGHGFFLEDGGEKDTYIRGNLGLGQRRFVGTTILDKTGAIPTDQIKGPVTYWITNPKTTVINNVAAGGDGMGMWFVYPDVPTGPSKTKNFMQDKEARHTKITQYKNNVHHSYGNAGLFVDNIEAEDLTVSGYNKYNPKEDPLDITSASEAAVFEGITAYKNKMQNAWIRGTPIIVTQSSFADSRFGATMIKEKNIWVEFVNNVVVGYSDNLGKPSNGFSRSFPKLPPPSAVGYRFNKGPVYVRNTWFDGFTSTPDYNATALANKKCFAHMNPQNQVENLKFSFADGPGNRFYFEDCGNDRNDEDGLFTLKDIESGLTGSSDVTIVFNSPFHVTGQCTARTRWNAGLCPYNYGEIAVSYPSDEELTIYRTDGNRPKRSILNKAFIAILGETNKNEENFQYLMVFEDGMPAAVTIEGESVTQSDTALLAYCVPPDAVLKFIYRIGSVKQSTEQVNSLADVQNDAVGGKYYVDSNVGVVFFKLVNNVEYAEGEKATCPSNQCVRVTIKVESGNRANSDCYDKFIQNSAYLQAEEGSPLADNGVLQATATDPPANWGAGSTYPPQP